MVVGAGADAREILIATGNPGKFREITAVLSEVSMGGGAVSVRWRSLKELLGDVVAPVEDGATFAENAAIKARYYARASGLWTLADDSGLEVEALAGAPGVLSARYAAAPAGLSHVAVDEANNKRLVSELSELQPEERSARFRCVLALADRDRVLATVEGSVEGLLIDKPRGSNGFGYDPHFYLPELGKTMAELTAEQKNHISHRGVALRRFREALGGLLNAES